jgi:hypothetical protein
VSPARPGPYDPGAPRFAAALGALAGSAVLAVSIPERWAQGAVEAGTFALGAAWLLGPARRLGRLTTHPLGCILAAAAGWPLLQLAAGLTVYREATWMAALEGFARLVCFQLAVEVFARGELRRAFRRAAAYAGLALSAVSTLAWFTSAGRIFWWFETAYDDQVLGAFVNRDHYAALMELLIPLAAYEAVRDARRRTVHVLAAGAMFASVIAGASRAGALLAALELAAMCLLMRRRGGPAPAPVFAAVLATASALATVAGWGPLWKRFQDPDPLRLRADMLRSAARMAGDRPLAGFGLGTFETVYPAYALFDNGRRVDHAHNDWAEWAADGGLPFAALLLAFPFWTLRRLRRAPWGLGVLAVFTHGTADFPMHKPPLALALFLLLGALAAAPSTDAGNCGSPPSPKSPTIPGWWRRRPAPAPGICESGATPARNPRPARKI